MERCKGGDRAAHAGWPQAAHTQIICPMQAALVFSREFLPPRYQCPPQGHAFEARIYAESPAAGFLPAGGTVLRWHTPPGAAAFE